MADDRPLSTQTAAPPVIPPRRPIVGLAMADDDDLRAWLDDQAKQLTTALHECDAIIAAIEANAARRRAHMDRFFNLPNGDEKAS